MAVPRTLVESRSVDWFRATLQFGAEGMLAIARSVDSFHQRLSLHDPSLRNDLDFAREHIGIHLNNPLDIRERLLDRVAALFSNQMIDGQDETLFLRLFRSERGKRQKDRS